MKLVYFILFISCFADVFSQQNNICGRLKNSCDEIDISLYNDDSIEYSLHILQTDTTFCFQNIKQGVYDLLINPQRKECPIVGYKIKNIKIDSSIPLGFIPLIKIAVCGDISFVIRKKNKKDTIFFNNGGIHSIGQYKKIKIASKKYFYPTGKWEIYSIEGKIERVIYYYENGLSYEIQYYSTGIIKCLGEREYGCVKGKWDFFNIEGGKTFSINYLNSDLYEIDYADFEKFALYYGTYFH